MNLPTENINTGPLRDGLHHSFTDKNKYVKRNVAVELETLAGATNIITKNVYSDVVNTYKSLSNLINDKKFVILAADKETCTVILNQTDNQNKVNNMINEGIAVGKYIETVDNTHKD